MMRTTSAVMIAVLFASGCAMTFQERPPKNPTSTMLCATESPMPVIDTVVGVTAMVSAAAGLYYAWGRNHESYVLPAGATAVGGMIALGSAREGFGWESECRSRVSNSAISEKQVARDVESR